MKTSSSVAARKRVKPAQPHLVRLDQKDTDKFIYDFLSSIGSPKALAVWLLYKHGEHIQLSQLECDPLSYIDPFRFRLDYSAVEFLSKANFLDLGIDREDVAINKFLAAEKQCAETNSRLRSWRAGDLTHLQLDACFHSMRWKIANILGEFSANEFVDSCAWGPGATTSLPRRYASSYNKFRTQTGATSLCATFLSGWMWSAYPGWSRWIGSDFFSLSTHLPDCFHIQPGNRVTTVPKNAKTDRVICIEPALNLWFQKGIGTMIRRRLRRSGFGIDEQTKNQQLCKIAVKRNLATVDFSSASDTISSELVSILMPEDWLKIMQIFRSSSGLLKGNLHHWNKFSTMGNGFTFELETLIFLSLALYVCDVLNLDKDFVSVFGDDVILPLEGFSMFKSLAELLGFTVNSEKSYSSGYFRESCGVHYFGDLDVKPLFLKERVSTIDKAFSFANGVRLLSHRWNSGFGCDSRFRKCWLNIVGRIPKELRFFGPLILGDSVIMSNWDEAAPSRPRKSWFGWDVTCLSRFPRVERVGEYPLLLSRFSEIGQDTPSRGNLSPLPGKGPLRVLRRVTVWSWHNFGLWL